MKIVFNHSRLYVRLTRAAAFCLLALAAVLCQSREARAQWTAPDAQGNISSTNTGNVGVGTATPATKLDVLGDTGLTIRGSGASPGLSFFDRPLVNGNQLVLQGNAGGHTVLSMGTRNAGIGSEKLSGIALWTVDNANAANATQFQMQNSPAYGGIMFTEKYGTGAQGDKKISFQTAWNQQVAPTQFVLDTTGNVGVGTASPSARLEVSGSQTGTASPLLISNAAAAGGGFYGMLQGLAPNLGAGDTAYLSFGKSPSTFNRGYLGYTHMADGSLSNHLSFGFYGAASLFNVLADGKVGIGTTTPGFKLDVQGGSLNAAGGLCIAGDCKTSWSQVGGASQWASAGSGISYGAGNVGIGTTSPGKALVVQNDAANNHLSIVRPTTNAAMLNIGIDNTGPFLESVTANKPISFYTHNGTAIAERVRITKDGSIGVGTTAPATKLHVAGDITVDGNINAKYQDVAEWVPSTQKLAAGTVVILDASRDNHVLASHGAYDTRVAGVVSAQPGLSLGERGEGKVLVATTGRVKVRVDATKSPIKIGDLIVTSGVEGVAMKSEPVNIGGVTLHRPGTLIGKALESLEKGTGEILVLLSLQ